jgi:hypothetical protein
MITHVLKDLVVGDLKFGSILKVIWSMCVCGEGVDLKVVCKYCRLQLHTKSGTSSLRDHIADSCPIIEEDVRKQFVSTMKKQPLEGSFVFDPQVSRE